MCAIFPALHERDRCFNWFIVSAANALLWLHCKHVHVLFKFAYACSSRSIYSRAIVKMERKVISPGLLDLCWWNLSKFVHNPDFHLGMDYFLPPNFNFSSIADCGESSLSPAPSTHHDVDSAGPPNISVPSENAAMAVDAEPIGNRLTVPSS